MCLSADWAGTLVLRNSSFFDFVFLLASFLRGCLVGLLFLGCSSSSSSFSGLCAGDCVSRPFLCFGLLWLSLCVGSCLACALSLWFFVCGAAGSRVPWLLLFLPPRLLCSFLLLLCGVVAVWPALSWLCPLLSCPPLWLVLWCLLVQSVFCWSLPPGIWLYLQRPGCHAYGMVCCD